MHFLPKCYITYWSSIGQGSLKHLKWLFTCKQKRVRDSGISGVDGAEIAIVGNHFDSALTTGLRC